MAMECLIESAPFKEKKSNFAVDASEAEEDEECFGPVRNTRVSASAPGSGKFSHNNNNGGTGRTRRLYSQQQSRIKSRRESEAAGESFAGKSFR